MIKIHFTKRIHRHTQIVDHCRDSLLSLLLFYQVDKGGKLNLTVGRPRTNLDKSLSTLQKFIFVYHFLYSKGIW